MIYCPWSKRPIYVGKGHRRQRAREHLRGERTNADVVAFITKCKRNGREPKIEYPREGLTETEALLLEAKLIAKYGRKGKGGTLLNRQGVKGYVRGPKLDPATRIIVLPSGKKKDLHRWGTGRWQRYEDLVSSKTVGEFLAKQPHWPEWERTIRHHAARDRIELRPPRKK